MMARGALDNWPQWQGGDARYLPVEECTRFRLVVNLKAARAFGVRVPKAVLSRPDQIID